MAAEGPIMQRARAHIPQTWDALARASVYGPELLTQKADTVKWRLWSTVAAPADEATFYNPVALDYAGKLIAIAVIPAGADYWADQLTGETTSGPSENISYPDRISSLWRIHARLLVEANDLAAEIDLIFGRVVRKRASMPECSDTGIPFATLDPATLAALNPGASLFPANLVPAAGFGSWSVFPGYGG